MFEMQLMAPVIAVLLECADWIEPHELPRYKAGINAAGNWDLATVAVFTCSASCCGGEDPTEGTAATCDVVEELAVVVCEDECHAP